MTASVAFLILWYYLTLPERLEAALRQFKIDNLKFSKIKRTTPKPDPTGFDTSSRGWAEHCEAWAVYFRLETRDKRRCYLAEVEARRGVASRRDLESRLMQLHKAATSGTSLELWGRPKAGPKRTPC